MVKKIPDIHEAASWTQDSELPKIPSYQNLATDVRGTFEWLMSNIALESLTMDELWKQVPQGLHKHYHIPEHDTYIAISALPVIYGTGSIQYAIAVYGKHNTGFFYVVENPTQSIWAKLQELVLGLEKK